MGGADGKRECCESSVDADRATGNVGASRLTWRKFRRSRSSRIVQSAGAGLALLQTAEIRAGGPYNIDCRYHCDLISRGDEDMT